MTFHYGEGSVASHRLDQYKRTPLTTPQGAQERRRQAALEERRRRRDASYSAATGRGLDGIGVGELALPDSSDEEEQRQDGRQGSKRKKQKQKKLSKTASATTAATAAAGTGETFANVLQQAEVLDTLPEDLDDNWLALPWIPNGRRVLARVDWDPRHREDRLTLYSRRRGEPINPTSSGQRAVPAIAPFRAGQDGGDEDEAPEISMVQDPPTLLPQQSPDLQLPTSFAAGPSAASSSSSQQQQQQADQPSPPARRRRPRNRFGRHLRNLPTAHSDYSIPLPIPLPRGTELDCVFSPRSAVLWALDIRRWGHNGSSSSSTTTDLRDCDAEFRLYWLSASLAEMEAPLLPAHFPANEVQDGDETGMLDATGPFPYPFIIKALPVVPAPIGRSVEEWKRKVIDVCKAQEGPPVSCRTAKVRRLVVAAAAAHPIPAGGEEGMDVDTAGTPAAATLVTVDALLFPTSQGMGTAAPASSSSSSDGLLLYHREAGYAEGEDKTPLAAWVPTTCAAEDAGGGMDLARFQRLLEEREISRATSTAAGRDDDSGGMGVHDGQMMRT